MFKQLNLAMKYFLQMTKSEIYKCHYYGAIHFDGILQKIQRFFALNILGVE